MPRAIDKFARCIEPGLISSPGFVYEKELHILAIREQADLVQRRAEKFQIFFSGRELGRSEISGGDAVEFQDGAPHGLPAASEIGLQIPERAFDFDGDAPRFGYVVAAESLVEFRANVGGE